MGQGTRVRRSVVDDFDTSKEMLKIAVKEGVLYSSTGQWDGRRKLNCFDQSSRNARVNKIP